MRRSVKVSVWTLGILLGVPLFLVALILIGANTQPGRDLIERMLPAITGGQVRLQGLGGRFPDALRAARIEVRDPEGTWLAIEHLTLDWAPSRLLIGEALIERLAAGRVELLRLPVSSGESSESADASLPLRVSLASLEVARLDLEPAVAGAKEAFSIAGRVRLASLTEGDVLLDVQGFDGTGRYHLDGSFDPTTLTGRLTAEEPENGLVARLAGFEGVGAILLDASINGPPSALATKLSLRAGALSANARGELDLPGRVVDMKVDASAPAMSPRPDLTWQSVALDATLSGPFERPTAAGTLRVTDLRAGGAGVQAVAADVHGDNGKVKLQASLKGVRIPGQRPDLLAAAPLDIEADGRLDTPERPITFKVEHPLIKVEGNARTAGEIRATISVSLPDLAPLAAAAGADVQGHSDLEIHADQKQSVTTLAASGTIAVTGSGPPVQGLLGDAARIHASAVLRGGDLSLSRLQLDGKGVQLSADGELVSKVADVGWRVSLTDLAAITPTLSGALQAHGRIQGPLDALSATADLSGELATKGFPRAPVSGHLEAKGLPSAPAGKMRINGTIAGSPLDLSVRAGQLADGTTRLDIERADWKSAHGEGQVTLAPGSSLPVGTLDLRMARLQDLAPLMEPAPTGAVTAKLQTTQGGGGETRARLVVDARAARLPGVGAVEHLSLAATALNPITNPILDAELVLDGLSANGVTGSGRLQVKGPQDALALQVSADATDSTGSPLRLTGEAALDATKKSVAVNAFQASWKGETLKLLAPARVAFAEGVDVRGLRVGVRDAVLEASGRIAPALDLTATVRNLSPALANAFVPDLQAEGDLQADARLRGSLARPTGTLRVEAKGLRMRGGPAGSLPAADLTATATLAGETARIEGRLTLGSKAEMALTGQAPLSATARMDLHAKGSADLALADPILTAGGRRVRGQVQVDAGVAGTLADPRLSGTIRLAGGEFQDYALGAHLTDIDALLRLDGSAARISRLAARAGSGKISASGTIGFLEPDIPIDVRLEAQGAKPLSSDLLTADLDASLTAKGQLTKELLLSGKIHGNKVEIRIPENLPTSVATLDVRRPGERPPTPLAPGPTVNLDLSIEAPEKIFVRGRGLDAEVGGKVRVQGTAANPQPIGSFRLRRGQFSLVGQTLTFSKGEVSFNGGSLVDPSLDFTVSKSDANVSAELNIGGTVRNPKISLSSTPQLPQDEILAEILFGRSASSLSPLELAQIASALAQLTGVTHRTINPLSSIRKGLGLDQLSVGTNASGQATLEAGRYVAPRVYVGVEQGASAGSTEAKVQVDLTKRLKLEGTVGTSSGSATGSADGGSSSIGITYGVEY